MISLFSVIQFSCETGPFNEDSDNIAKVEVEFEALAKEVDENDGEGTVVLRFSKPAPQDAILSLQPGEGYEGVVTTLPAIENGLINITVRKGDRTAEVKVKPVDNTQKDGHKVLTFQLHNLPSPFTAGIKSALTMTVMDDETSNPLQESVASFVDQDTTLEESNLAGIQYTIRFSKPAGPGSGIGITVASEKAVYGVHYETVPAAQQNVISVPVTEGLTEVTFTVKGIDNPEITGEFNVTFTITGTSGSILKGDNLVQDLLIKDDELARKPKGYVITSANATVRKFYEYDAQGRISKVNWETFTSFLTRGTDTYYYDAGNRLTRMNKHAGLDVNYLWLEGRIARSEEVREGVIQSYREYAYDDAGNVNGVVNYHRQEDGSYAKGLFLIFLYYQDGNVYKSLLYNDNANNPDEPWLVSTKTYENYIDVANPFPMVEVLPLVNTQKNLSTSYRVEENGLDLRYNLVYTYRADGLPVKRIAEAQGDVQTAVYYYY